MKKILPALAALALATAVASAQPAYVKMGTLACDISGGLGLIIGSQKSMECLYTPASPARQEVYVGVISKFGLDIGATAGGQMLWQVYAPTAGGPWALAGVYSGASAEATVGAGLGANILVGGSARTVALQPVSVQGQAGLNLAVGVTSLELRPAR